MGNSQRLSKRWNAVLALSIDRGHNSPILFQRQHAFYPHSLAVVELHILAVRSLKQSAATNWRHQRLVLFCRHLNLLADSSTGMFAYPCRSVEIKLITTLTLSESFVSSSDLHCPFYWHWLYAALSVLCRFVGECFVSGVIVKDCAASMPGLSLVSYSPTCCADKQWISYMRSMGEKLAHSQRILRFRASYDAG